MQEVAPQLGAVGRLAHQVQLVLQVLGELRHHLARLQAAAVRPQHLDQAGGGIEQGDVVGDDAADARPQDLHCHLAPVGQGGEVHLRHRGARHRIGRECGEHFRHRLAEGALQLGRRQRRGKGRHLVLQFRQLVGEVHRQQVAPRRQHLAELDEDRPQRLQRQAQPHRARHRQIAPEKDAGEQPRQALGARLVEDQLVEAEADADADDFQEAEQAQDRAVIGKALILAAFDAATDGRPGAGGYNPPFPGH
jgi:hypothetical protein